MINLKRRILNILISLDQFLWTLITLGKGYPDETISAAAWRMQEQGKLAGKILRPVIDFLFLDNQHCHKSFISESLRKQLPEYYRVDQVSDVNK